MNRHFIYSVKPHPPLRRGCVVVWSMWPATRLGRPSLPWRAVAVHTAVVSLAQASVENVLDVLDDEVDGHQVIGSTWNDHISILLGRQTELLKGRLNKRYVLSEHLLQVSTTITDVPENSAGESSVCVGVDKKFHLEKVPDLLRVEHEDPLEQDHIGRIDGHKLFFPGMGNKVVNWDLNRLALNDLPQGLHHQLVIKGIWVVKVVLALEGLGLLLRRELPVEAVLAEDGHLPLGVLDLVLAQ